MNSSPNKRKREQAPETKSQSKIWLGLPFEAGAELKVDDIVASTNKNDIVAKRQEWALATGLEAWKEMLQEENVTAADGTFATKDDEDEFGEIARDEETNSIKFCDIFVRDFDLLALDWKEGFNGFVPKTSVTLWGRERKNTRCKWKEIKFEISIVHLEDFKKLTGDMGGDELEDAQELIQRSKRDNETAQCYFRIPMFMAAQPAFARLKLTKIRCGTIDWNEEHKFAAQYACEFAKMWFSKHAFASHPEKLRKSAADWLLAICKMDPLLVDGVRYDIVELNNLADKLPVKKIATAAAAAAAVTGLPPLTKKPKLTQAVPTKSDSALSSSSSSSSSSMSDS